MPHKLITQREALGKLPFPADKVILRNLSVTPNAGFDAWGRQKIQPALISLTLTLRQAFNSAASNDEVDNSTVHYGKLSKLILSTISERADQWISTRSLADLVNNAANDIANTGLLAACEVNICYTKASMLGDSAGLLCCFNQQAEVSSTVYLSNLMIPTLIGVNSNERERKQQVILNVWVDYVKDEEIEAYTAIESTVTKTVEESSYETLESLVTKVEADLRTDLLHILSAQTTVRIRAEKPVAVPFADGPAIEIVRNC